LTKANPKRWLSAKSVAVFLAGFVVGLALGFVVRRYLVFKNEVVVGDLINLFSATLVALILQNAIQKRVSNVRVEKDLLIARIAAFDAALTEIHRLFLKRAADRATVDDSVMYASFGDLSNHLYILEMALNNSKTPMTAIDLSGLKRARHEYRERILGEDFYKGYSQGAINREGRAYRNFTTALISIQFEVNQQ
jgi:hypothetical protein